MAFSEESERLLKEMKNALRHEKEGFPDSGKARKRIRQLQQIERCMKTNGVNAEDSDELFRVLHTHISSELNPEMVFGVYTSLKELGVEHPEQLMTHEGMNKRNMVVTAYASAIVNSRQYIVTCSDRTYGDADMSDVCAMAMQSDDDTVEIILSAISVRHILSARDIIEHLKQAREIGAPLTSGVL